MEYNKISYVKIVKYGEAGIIDNWLYVSFDGFRFDLESILGYVFDVFS